MGWIFDGSRPIYVQLLEQIRLRIVCGVYRPGEKLPSVRELAQEAAVAAEEVLAAVVVAQAAVVDSKCRKLR